LKSFSRTFVINATALLRLLQKCRTVTHFTSR